MARTAFSITKRCAFRDSLQEFSNVYHYEDSSINLGVADAASLVDWLVTKERAFHSGDVTFVRAKAWQAGGTAFFNEMIYEADLTGTGSGPSSSNIDRERAILVQFPAGKDSRNRQVYLRKWFHTMGPASANVTILAGILENKTKFTAQNLSDLRAVFLPFLNPAPAIGGPYTLVAPGGREAEGAVQVHPYFEHHQLGEMWRG